MLLLFEEFGLPGYKKFAIQPGIVSAMARNFRGDGIGQTPMWYFRIFLTLIRQIAYILKVAASPQ